MELFESLPWLALKRIFKYADMESCINIHEIVRIPEIMWRKKIERWYGIKPEELIVSWNEIFKEHILTCIYANVNINTKNELGNTALHYASHYGKKEIVELLINIEGIEINVISELGNTPLHIASMKGRKEIVELLINIEGIEINKQDQYGWTALHLATWYGQKEIVELLINIERIEINARNNNGDTALHIASMNRRKGIEELLIDRGATE